MSRCRCFPSNALRVWRPTENGLVSITSGTPFTIDEDRTDIPLLLEGKVASVTPVSITLSEKVPGDSTFRNQGKTTVRVFKVEGARNVPGFSKYEYVATGGAGAGTSTFVTPDDGAEDTNTPTNTQDKQTVLWSEGAAFGKVRYRASAEYTWAFDVAIVKVDIDMDAAKTKLTAADQATNGPIQNGKQPWRIDSTSAPRLNSDADPNNNVAQPTPAMTIEAAINSVTGPTRTVDGVEKMFGNA